LIVWGGLRVAATPADYEHPYGHGKAESLAAVIVSLILLGGAVAIAVQSVREIAVPHHPPAPFTLIILVAVIAVKWILAHSLLKSGMRMQSASIIADAAHHRSDAITSGAA